MAEDSKADKAAEKEHVALELMKFIAVTTGYGKGGPGAGFAREKANRSPEEYAESLLELFDRCRSAVNKPAK